VREQGPARSELTTGMDIWPFSQGTSSKGSATSPRVDVRFNTREWRRIIALLVFPDRELYPGGVGSTSPRSPGVLPRATDEDPWKRARAVLWQRLLGGQRLSLADYVTGSEARDRATAAGWR
jgi:hypothetical protein